MSDDNIDPEDDELPPESVSDPLYGDEDADDDG